MCVVTPSKTHETSILYENCWKLYAFYHYQWQSAISQNINNAKLAYVDFDIAQSLYIKNLYSSPYYQSEQLLTDL